METSVVDASARQFCKIVRVARYIKLVDIFIEDIA